MQLRVIVWLGTMWLLKSHSAVNAQNRTLKQCWNDLQQKQQADFDAFVKASARKTKSAGNKQAPVDNSQRDWQDWASCVKGLMMPAFNVTTLTGETIHSAQLKGKIILINFWFMGCPPCIAELPALNRLVDEYKDKGITFIGFSTDRKAQLKSEFFDKHPFNFQIVPDAKSVADSFGFIGYPTTFIVDQEGKITEVFQGGPMSEATQMVPYLKARDVIDSLLAAKK